MKYKKKKRSKFSREYDERIKKRFQRIRWDRKFDSRTKPTVSCDLFFFFFKDKSSVYIYVWSAYNYTTDVRF